MVKDQPGGNIRGVTGAWERIGQERWPGEHKMDILKYNSHIDRRSFVIISGASVIAPTAIEAGALATSMIVMSTADGMRLIDSLPQCEALIISSAKQITRSAGWKGFYT
jgi:hypothetical protein